jgi:hypothetical protein
MLDIKGLNCEIACPEGLTYSAQERLQPGTNTQIDQTKKQCGNGGHDKNHHCRQQNFPSRRPNDLRNF